MIADTQDKGHRWLRWILRASVTLSLAGWLLSKLEFGELIHQWKQTDWLVILVLSPVLYLVSVSLMALRWRIILRGQGIASPSRPLILIHLRGSFLSGFLPGPIPGDIYRSLVLSKETQRNLESISSVLMERGIGVLALLVLSLVGLYYAIFVVGSSEFEAIAPIVLWVTGVVSGVGFAVIVIAHLNILDRIRLRWSGWSRMQAFFKTIPRHFSNLGDLLKVCFLSLFIQLCVVLMTYVLSRASHYSLSFQTLCITIPLIVLITMIPISVSGLGMREAAFVFFFAPFGLSTTEAVSLSLLMFTVITCLRLASGLAFFVSLSYVEPESAVTD